MALGLTQPNPILPSALGFSLCVCLLILCVSLPTSAWLWLSLSCLSVAFLLSDLADLGPGPFLPGADTSVSVFCVAGSLVPAPLVLQNVPHKTSLPEGIRVGTVMRIRGVVPDKAGR